ncbi:MAG: hypothetical protein HC781_21650 [Leptolyngbyaceae cyanobacterium CSU_1_4]|nr:hypothetical protein [Leptolyngbyaceae cyanobacterium CSU_1_4]
MPLPILFLTKFYSLFPNLGTNLFAVGNQFLPEPGGRGEKRTLGKDSRSALSPAALTYLSDRAAQENNEHPVIEQRGR